MKRFDKDFLKSVFCLLIIQAIIYFFIKYAQGSGYYIKSFIDDYFPFIPSFIYIYNLFYPFLFVVLYWVYKSDKKVFYFGIVSGIIGYLICDVIFLAFPTIMIRPDIDALSIDFLTRFALNLTYKFDTPALNCFPSVHCLFCFQALLMIFIAKNMNINKKLILSLIAILIVLSTLLVKQHYFYDVFGALVVFGISNIVANIFKLDDKYKKWVRCMNE